jgi:integrase
MSEQLTNTRVEPPTMRRGRRGLRGQKPPLKVKEIWAIRIRLQLEERIRDLAMFNLAIDSKLRACDLTALKVDDVAMSGRIGSRAIVIQKKTGRPVQFEITEQTRDAVARWIDTAGFRHGGFLFPSRICAWPQYMLANTPDWSHAGSPHSAWTLRVTARIRCGERRLHVPGTDSCGLADPM